MPRKELSKNSKYYVDANLYKQCVYFCRQYPKWEMELKTEPDTSKAIDYSKDRVQTSGDGDSTSKIAMRRHMIEKKKELVDYTISESVPEILQKWVLLGVATGCSEWELKEKGMDASRNTYFKYRRIFFYNLSKKM